jgi:hypothetical protein
VEFDRLDTPVMLAMVAVGAMAAVGVTNAFLHTGYAGQGLIQRL